MFTSIDPHKMPKVMALYLKISQYPILARRIRERMRQELFSRGIISPKVFIEEVREKAILSQKREGLFDPMAQELPEVWEERLRHIRDHLTDFYFAYNLPHELFEDIVQEAMAERHLQPEDVILPFNPELAPWDLLFAQGEEYESYSPEKRAKIQHHLQEIIVVLIKSMISDQLGFVGIAKEWFTIADLKEIRRRRIGRGKIGGKAAGLLLAWKILNSEEENSEYDGIDLKSHLAIPESYFIGADAFYDFLSLNRLHGTLNQKYKTREQIEADYPAIREAYIGGRFPDDIVYGLRELLKEVGNAPLIVRSSSLLEDNFGTSFAGKYDSFFCPNQGSPEENLEALTLAISKVYASVPSPVPILYRQHMGLVDYDERMAVLIQKVQGTRCCNFFFPALAGVGFSLNPFRWNSRIRQEDGFLRIVWGLGTRAVERVANDYPRMVALSHPQLRPEAGAKEIKRYSQRFIDLIDLEDNQLKTLPIREVLSVDYPAVRFLASVDKGGYLQPMFSQSRDIDPQQLVLTFDSLLKDTALVPLMKAILKKLERRYGWPVDIEFTVDIGSEPFDPSTGSGQAPSMGLPSAALGTGRAGSAQGRYPQPSLTVHLVQCRPQSSHESDWRIQIPSAVPEEDVIFSANKLVPQGLVPQIRYIVYVDPEKYDRIPDPTTKLQLARVVGHINQHLEGQRFILMGPGRWGSSNLDLGLKVTYADIHNTSVLVEIALAREEGTPELSYGTHFFQNLVEARIYPLPLYPHQDDTVFDTAFFQESPNILEDLLPADGKYAEYVKIIDVPAITDGRYLEVVMDSEKGKAVGYLKCYDE
jgi:hypothetical protein